MRYSLVATVLAAASLAGALTQREDARVYLRSVVRTVRWKRGRVDVRGTFAGEPFQASASRAVITLPLGVLQLARGVPHAVHFAPALSEKRAALRSLGAGSAVKIVLRFRTPFWEALDRSREVTQGHTRKPLFRPGPGRNQRKRHGRAASMARHARARLPR